MSVQKAKLDFQLDANSLCFINYDIPTPNAQEEDVNAILEVLVAVDGNAWQVTLHSFCPIIDSTVVEVVFGHSWILSTNIILCMDV